MGRKKKTSKEYVEYPCEIVVGDKILTKNDRLNTVAKIDGRTIYFEDGSQYNKNHPDLLFKVIEEQPNTNEENPVTE